MAARQTIAAPSRRLGGSGSTAGGSSGSEEPGIDIHNMLYRIIKCKLINVQDKRE